MSRAALIYPHQLYADCHADFFAANPRMAVMIKMKTKLAWRAEPRERPGCGGLTRPLTELGSPGEIRPEAHDER